MYLFIYIYIFIIYIYIYIIISKTPFVDGSTFAHFAPHPPVEPIASLRPGVAKAEGDRRYCFII